MSIVRPSVPSAAGCNRVSPPTAPSSRQVPFLFIDAAPAQPGISGGQHIAVAVFVAAREAAIDAPVPRPFALVAGEADIVIARLAFLQAVLGGLIVPRQAFGLVASGVSDRVCRRTLAGFHRLGRVLRRMIADPARAPRPIRGPVSRNPGLLVSLEVDQLA